MTDSTPTIIQGTTPSIVFDFTSTEIPTSSFTAFEMTISDCAGVKITKTEPTYSETYKATVYFSQEDTLALQPGDYRIQIRIQTASKTCATRYLSLKVLPLASRSVI